MPRRVASAPEAAPRMGVTAARGPKITMGGSAETRFGGSVATKFSSRSLEAFRYPTNPRATTGRNERQNFAANKLTIISCREQSQGLSKPEFSRPGVQNTYRRDGIFGRSAFAEFSTTSLGERFTQSPPAISGTNRYEGLQVIPSPRATRRFEGYRTRQQRITRESSAGAENVKNNSASTTIDKERNYPSGSSHTNSEKSVAATRRWGRRLATPTINSLAALAQRREMGNVRRTVPVRGTDSVVVLPDIKGKKTDITQGASEVTQSRQPTIVWVSRTQQHEAPAQPETKTSPDVATASQTSTERGRLQGTVLTTPKAEELNASAQERSMKILAEIARIKATAPKASELPENVITEIPDVTRKSALVVTPIREQIKDSSDRTNIPVLGGSNDSVDYQYALEQLEVLRRDPEKRKRKLLTFFKERVKKLDQKRKDKITVVADPLSGTKTETNPVTQVAPALAEQPKTDVQRLTLTDQSTKVDRLTVVKPDTKTNTMASSAIQTNEQLAKKQAYRRQRRGVWLRIAISSIKDIKSIFFTVDEAAKAKREHVAFAAVESYADSERMVKGEHVAAAVVNEPQRDLTSALLKQIGLVTGLKKDGSTGLIDGSLVRFKNDIASAGVQDKATMRGVIKKASAGALPVKVTEIKMGQEVGKKEVDMVLNRDQGEQELPNLP